jgi:beta-carotene hydroxylase
MSETRMPRLTELGSELTESTIGRRYVAVGVPLLCVAGYFWLACVGVWPLAVLCVMAYSFFSYGSTSHDLVHGNLGFKPRENAFWLSLIELLGLRSGHAYRAAHLHHHACFPSHDDIEGEAAYLSFWRAIASGPMHGSRICRWAFRHERRFRKWMAVEMGLCALLFAAAIVALRWTLVPAIYVALVVAGSWAFPLVTAYFPHDPAGATVLQQTRRFRGPLYRILFLDHLYHLEHHLYPRVPRHHWAQLARRLDPWLEERGVKVDRVRWTWRWKSGPRISRSDRDATLRVSTTLFRENHLPECSAGNGSFPQAEGELDAGSGGD